jgi:hypothetical protein
MGSFDEENQRTKISRYCPFKGQCKQNGKRQVYTQIDNNTETEKETRFRLSAAHYSLHLDIVVVFAATGTIVLVASAGWRMDGPIMRAKFRFSH